MSELFDWGNIGKSSISNTHENEEDTNVREMSVGEWVASFFCVESGIKPSQEMSECISDPALIDSVKRNWVSKHHCFQKSGPNSWPPLLNNEYEIEREIIAPNHRMKLSAYIMKDHCEYKIE